VGGNRYPVIYKCPDGKEVYPTGRHFNKCLASLDFHLACHIYIYKGPKGMEFIIGGKEDFAFRTD